LELPMRTVGLDAKQIILIRQTLLEWRGLGMLLISSHIRSELETTGSHSPMINGGELVSTGSLADIDNPRLNSNAMRIDHTPSGFSDGIITGFLSDNQLTRECIEFKFRRSLYKQDHSVCHKSFRRTFVNIGRESSSLEEVSRQLPGATGVTFSERLCETFTSNVALKPTNYWFLPPTLLSPQFFCSISTDSRIHAANSCELTRIPLSHMHFCDTARCPFCLAFRYSPCEHSPKPMKRVWSNPYKIGPSAIVR
jgi:hypothetical protein